MPTFLLGWRIYAVLGGLIAFIGLGLYINHIFLQAAKVPGLEKEVSDLQLQMKTQADKYEEANKITQKVGDDYEKAITKRDADIKRLSKRPASCISVYPAQPASGSDATNQPDKPSAGNGVSSSFLISYSGECETDRIKVIALQDFIAKVWADNVR